jgi:protein phosphatase
MFLCPYCQFENPSQNRFCQQCGNPLKGLRAILMPDVNAIAESQKLSAELSQTALQTVDSSEDTGVASTGITLAEFLIEDQYLDIQKRYRLRNSVPVDNQATEVLNQEFELEVIDCNPGNLSPINHFFDTNPNLKEEDFQDHFPLIASTYWKLQEIFFPVLPELQSAWVKQDIVVLIIEDRSHWNSLCDVLKSAKVEPLELVHWFYEIINLWDEFIDLEVVDSLLLENNFCVDADDILCLRRLHFTPAGKLPTLTALGSVWQFILSKLPYWEIEALSTLVQSMMVGEVMDTTAIKDSLSAIADDLQQQTQTQIPSESPGEEIITPVDTPPEISPNEPGEPSLSLEISEEDDPPQLILENVAMTEMMTDLDEEIVEDIPSDWDGDAAGEGASELPTMALPTKLYRVDEVGKTHVGRQRAHNEDSFFAETKLERINSPQGATLRVQGLYILCDGMGGHSGGEVASALAVNALRDYFDTHWQTDLPDPEVVKAGILQANQVIYHQNEAEERVGSARMGTTLVMLLLLDNQAVVAHVGDSRLYCLTRNGLKQTTVDHEVGQREISRGVEPTIAYARPDAYQLTQALGPRGNNEVMPSITTLPINQDILFLLCSDGLSDNDLLETHLESYLTPLLRSHADLEEGIADLIDLANEHNGHDNITAILVRVKVRPNLELLPN